ncbi:OLC1v1013308C1 [Oldenlandia corymbosa var. corymbosa]|uniref:OLC1v1013308C1 n=1 Tax=Oldenlandia corymbosa var. corymbosa TaxID=529605 RepID=A0AAV1DY59_OLDCO|nr:OLC1v1013308C1 [Oldenlandia corymbosa var. corymbosa]
MTANMDIVMPRCLSFKETDYFERPLASKSCNASKDWTSKHNLSGLISMSATKCEFLRMKSPQASRSSWRTAFALNTGGLPENNQESFDNSGSGLGATRLGRIVGAAGRQLLEKLSSTKKNFPMEVDEGTCMEETGSGAVAYIDNEKVSVGTLDWTKRKQKSTLESEGLATERRKKPVSLLLLQAGCWLRSAMMKGFAMSKQLRSE